MGVLAVHPQQSHGQAEILPCPCALGKITGPAPSSNVTTGRTLHSMGLL
jgi:hypothetical protein